MPLIYKITSPSGKVYIGQTWDWPMRQLFYRTLNCKTQIGIYNSLLKHGVDNHEFKVICELPEDVEQAVLDSYEKIYWEFYKDCNILMLNCREPGRGGKLSEETRRKLSECRIGKKVSEKHRERIAETNRSDKERLKRSNTLKGHPVSEETKRKISEKIKQKWASNDYATRKSRKR
jgi:group I intron endonuclease